MGEFYRIRMIQICNIQIPVVRHKAVPEVSKGKVYINQKKDGPIGSVCELLK